MKKSDLDAQSNVVKEIKKRNFLQIVGSDVVDKNNQRVGGISPYTWAGKPDASELAVGSLIRVPASEFSHSSIPLTGMVLESDGVKYIPAFGGQILAQEWGSISSPIATLDSDSETVYTLPGGIPNALSGMLLPGCGIEINAFFKDTGTHTAGGAINARMGISDSLLTNGVVGFASGAAGTDFDTRISTTVRMISPTAYIYHNFTTTNGAAANPRVYGMAGLFGSAYDHNFSFSRAHSGTNDVTLLIGYTIKLVP